MRTIVGVLRGGPSREHEVSLATGAAMLAGLPEERFISRDIFIDKKGVWHERGREISADKILRQVDVALIGLHGDYGEDGEIQKLLDTFGVRYAGTKSHGSYLALHKAMAKQHASDHGISTAEFRYIIPNADIETSVREIVRTIHQPVVIKPVSWGSSIGISIVGGYAEVLQAVGKLIDDGARGILVEEYIRGREATVGIVEGLRGETLYALPAVEIIPFDDNFFSYTAKYSGKTQEICPGNFSLVEREELLRAAKIMHRALGLRHYSRSDFIVGSNGIYYLETNTLPGLTTESLMPKALASVGISLPEFLTHLVDSALANT